MDQEKCIKYLSFLAKECERHLHDNIVDDDELQQMNIALIHFKKTCEASDLPNFIKSKVSTLYFDFDLSHAEDAKYSFGLIWKLRGYRNEAKKKHALENFRGKVSNLIIDIRLNS